VVRGFLSDFKQDTSADTEGPILMPSAECTNLATNYGGFATSYVMAIASGNHADAAMSMENLVATHNAMVAEGCVKGLYQVVKE